jgi:hypothetical protein
MDGDGMEANNTSSSLTWVTVTPSIRPTLTMRRAWASAWALIDTIEALV